MHHPCSRQKYNPFPEVGFLRLTHTHTHTHSHTHTHTHTHLLCLDRLAKTLLAQAEGQYVRVEYEWRKTAQAALQNFQAALALIPSSLIQRDARYVRLIRSFTGMSHMIIYRLVDSFEWIAASHVPF
jgi:hypothetical protein